MTEFRALLRVVGRVQGDRCPCCWQLHAACSSANDQKKRCARRFEGWVEVVHDFVGFDVVVQLNGLENKRSSAFGRNEE